MKIKFTDFGRCLICLHNPCDCKKKTNKKNRFNICPICKKLKKPTNDTCYDCKLKQKKYDKSLKEFAK